MNEPLFRYEPLLPSQIRLIILPAAQDRNNALSTISCQMLHEKHGEMPYTALSYTWGSALQTRSIKVNGQVLLIGENLWQALHGLLFHAPPGAKELRLWIDAVCINQNDIPERNQQVAMMSKIYREADEVAVWLGPGDDETDAAMLSLADVKTGDSTSSNPSNPVFKPLFNRNYFTRVWIIQEVILAKYAKVYCGNKSLTWEQFAAPFDGWSGSAFASSLAHSLYRSRKRYHSNVTCDLVTLIRLHSLSQCFDPRDKIYGFLGIAKDCDRGNYKQPPWYIPSADYSKDISTVYQDIIRFWTFKKGANRCHMYLAGYSQLLQESIGQSFVLPASSDVEDFSIHDPEHSYHHFPSPLIPVSGSEHATITRLGPTFSLEDCAIMDTGRAKVDAIHVNLPKPSDDKIFHYLPDIMNIDESAGYAFYPVRGDLTPPNWFWRSVCRVRHIISSLVTSFLLRIRMSKRHHKYQFFTFGPGHIGIGPLGLRRGDTICQFYSSSLSVIIRPVQFGSCCNLVGSVVLFYNVTMNNMAQLTKQVGDDATIVEWAAAAGMAMRGKGEHDLARVNRNNQPTLVTFYLKIGILQQLTKFNGLVRTPVFG